MVIIAKLGNPQQTSYKFAIFTLFIDNLILQQQFRGVTEKLLLCFQIFQLLCEVIILILKRSLQNMNYQILEFLYLSGIIEHESMTNIFSPSLLGNFSEIPYLPLERNLNISPSLSENFPVIPYIPIQQSLYFQSQQAHNLTIRDQIPDQQNQILQEKNQNQAMGRKKSGRRHTNQQTQISSAKRNAEQNIINQFFSYYNESGVSLRIIKKILIIMGLNEKTLPNAIEFVHVLIRTLNSKRKRKYMSKRYLLKLFHPQSIQGLLPEINQKVKSIEGLNLDLICSFFRRLVQSYLKATYQSGVMTSRRITCLSKQHHLSKLRKLKILTACLSQNQKEFTQEQK